MTLRSWVQLLTIRPYIVTQDKIIFRNIINTKNTKNTPYRVHVKTLAFQHELDTAYRVHV